MLAYLLARQGVRVTLFEAHDDFDREFRGDTLHPSTLELMDQLDLADELLQLPHHKLEQAVLETTEGRVVAAEFRGLRTKFPYIALMPQARFLEFMVGQADKFDHFELRMGANVRSLVREQDRVVGVSFQDEHGEQTMSAPLVVACDGRFSRLRKQSGLELKKTAPPMDVLWFRLPHGDQPTSTTLMGRIHRGRMSIVLPRKDHDQVGYVILKGSFRAVRDEGLEKFRQRLLELSPAFGDRVQAIQAWSQITPLSVESSRLKRWYLPGLLLIGDAAHVMSPVGGVGINYAIQDAVAASNLLGAKLLQGAPPVADLRAVQRRRELPTRIIQAFQAAIQRRVIGMALSVDQAFRLPWVFKLPLLRQLPARLIAFGFRRERIES
jgi:2-polyprenyl-6-methoxyphenol hydroxylase-like FAD-dependent oxidoreductase